MGMSMGTSFLRLFSSLTAVSCAVFASFAGSPKHPDWFHSLVANPDVTIEVGSETIPARARVTDGDARETIWSAQKDRITVFAGYEEKAAPREISVVLLERRG